MVQQVLVSIGLFFLILVAVNVPAPFIGLDFGPEKPPRLWYQPPGFVIPIVWFILFTLLGLARYKVLAAGAPALQWWLFVLAFLCASYAYYTLGLAKLTEISALWFGLFGNIIVILFALLVAWKVYPVSASAAWLVVPVAAWTAFASLIVVGEMKLESLI